MSLHTAKTFAEGKESVRVKILEYFSVRPSKINYPQKALLSSKKVKEMIINEPLN